MKKFEGLFVKVETVYVVFMDETSLWWLRFLKKGFRHCYLLVKLDDGMTWLEINPMSNQLFIEVYQFFESVDFIGDVKKVLSAEICEVNVENVGLKTAPLSFFTCVEMVKRVIGLHNRFVITPYQLYKKINNCRKKVLT